MFLVKNAVTHFEGLGDHEAFVVGATNQNRIVFAQDEKASFSRFGANISTFAPGQSVLALNFNGTQTTVSGTSFAAPYIAGIFAVGCQVAAPFCSTIIPSTKKYRPIKYSD